MGRFEATTTIAAARARVYAYRLDVTHLPAYNPDVSDVRPVAVPAGAVAAYAFRLRMAPGWSTTARLVVTEAAAPARLVFEIDSLMRARETCTFEPTTVAARDGRAAAATLVRFETEVLTPGGPLRPLVDALFVMPNLRRQTLRELDLMQRNLEGTDGP